MDQATDAFNNNVEQTPQDKQDSGAQPTQNESQPSEPTGLKTSRRKSSSNRNAIKMGLYSKELFIAPEEKPEFTAMRNSLKLQLGPDNPIKWTALERVIVACWHYKLGVRMVNRQIAQQLVGENRTTPESEEAEVMPVVGE